MHAVGASRLKREVNYERLAGGYGRRDAAERCGHYESISFLLLFGHDWMDRAPEQTDY